MGTILSLLAFFVGATLVITIGTRISLYLHQQELLEIYPLTARKVQPSLSEAQFLLESSGTGYVADSMGTSSRYAWIALGVFALIVLLVILVIAGLLSNVVL